MDNKSLLQLICYYLLLTPVVSSINGLSLHLYDISLFGPAYHGLFSLVIILAGLFSNNVEKKSSLVLLVFSYFVFVVILHWVLGLSSIADTGQLYKWFFPVLMFVVFQKWSYFAKEECQKSFLEVFAKLPVIYSFLILISFLAYYIFGFEATLFAEGAKRFSGFAFAYNPTVNVLILCGLLNFIYFRTPIHRRIFFAWAFYNLRSKLAVLYFLLIGFSLVKKWFLEKRYKLRFAFLGFPILLFLGWFGYVQSLDSADLYGTIRSETSLTGEVLLGSLYGGRLGFVLFFVDDFPRWPLVNKLFGNGMNIDRRLNSNYDLFVGSQWYESTTLTKANKNFELDLMGPIDMFGITGMIFFVSVFYVYPIVKIRLRFFRPFYFVVIVLSLYGGHIVNNPQVAPLLVFLILLLKNLPSKDNLPGVSIK